MGIVAISGTFADYLRLVDVDSFIDNRRLSGMLGIYQHLLSKRTQDFHAFRILEAIFQYVPLSKLSNYMKEIIELVCRRIRSKKSTALCCHFVIALSLFIIKNDGIQHVVKACNDIQNGIFAMILEKIWLVYARNVTDLIDRKILTVGMIKMSQDPHFKNDANLMKFYPNIINCVVEIFEAGPLQSNEQKTADFYIKRLEEQGAGNKFVGLQFAKSPSHDITKQLKMADPREILIKSMANTIGQNNQNKQMFASSSKPIICKTINGYAQKFNVNFNLPILQ